MVISKRETVDNSAERLLLTGIIVSDIVANNIMPIFDVTLLTTPYSVKVAKWCKDYWERHRLAPKAHIKDIFESYRSLNGSDTSLDVIEDLLEDLSEHFAHEDVNFNEEYVIGEVEKYIKSLSAQKFSKNFNGLVQQGRVDEAEALLCEYRMPKREESGTANMLSDEFWNGNEEDDKQVLFKLGSGLGKMLGTFDRNSFTSFMSRSKVGKTNTLLHLATIANRQKCNVMFFSVGDMSEKQIRGRLRRFWTGYNPKLTSENIIIPILDCEHNQKGTCPHNKPTDSIYVKKGNKDSRLTFAEFPEHTVCVDCLKTHKYDFVGAYWHQETLTSSFRKDITQYRQDHMKHACGKELRLKTYPSYGASVATFENELSVLQDRYTFVPDVIVIDYADLLAPEPYAVREDSRNKINSNWIQMRALSMKLNCAVITATQSAKGAGRLGQLDMDNVSEDRRKIDHVTAMYGINQSYDEKRSGILRINCLAKREEEYDPESSAIILQNLNVGRYHLGSYIEEVEYERR